MHPIVVVAAVIDSFACLSAAILFLVSTTHDRRLLRRWWPGRRAQSALALSVFLVQLGGYYANNPTLSEDGTQLAMCGWLNMALIGTVPQPYLYEIGSWAVAFTLAAFFTAFYATCMHILFALQKDHIMARFALSPDNPKRQWATRGTILVYVVQSICGRLFLQGFHSYNAVAQQNLWIQGCTAVTVQFDLYLIAPQVVAVILLVLGPMVLFGTAFYTLEKRTATSRHFATRHLVMRGIFLTSTLTVVFVLCVCIFIVGLSPLSLGIWRLIAVWIAAGCSQIVSCTALVLLFRDNRTAFLRLFGVHPTHPTLAPQPPRRAVPELPNAGGGRNNPPPMKSSGTEPKPASRSIVVIYS